MNIRWKLVAGIGALAVATVPLVVTAATRSVEQPKYSVVTKAEAFEVRNYAPRIVAEVTVEGTGKAATNKGFRVLADYIFGNNATQTKVAMTAPVDRRASEKISMTAPVDRTKRGERWVVAFTMPSKYTLETLPTPVNDRINIRLTPRSTYAVSRFSGAPNEKVVAQRMAALVESIEEAGLERTGTEPTYARYDPPWTPSFLRRNEIFVELAPDPESDR